jgi:SAM-dependent methyltransferase
VFRDRHDYPVALGPEADLRHAAAMRWFATQPGASILAAESRVLSEHLADRFGYHLLQVGVLPGVDLLRGSRILHRCVVDLDGGGTDSGYPHLRGRAGALPVESDSVDVMLLPHVLEFEPRPHEALREAARVLVPEGYLFVSALNPWSLLGVWRAARRRGGNAPWSGRFLAQGRMRDWLELVGLELLSVNAVFFRPPLRNARVLDRLAVLESVGSRLWPMFCGAYVLGARKRVARATPIRAPIRYRPRLVGVGLAGPSTRVRDDR